MTFATITPEAPSHDIARGRQLPAPESTERPDYIRTSALALDAHRMLRRNLGRHEPYGDRPRRVPVRRSGVRADGLLPPLLLSSRLQDVTLVPVPRGIARLHGDPKRSALVGCAPS